MVYTLVHCCCIGANFAGNTVSSRHSEVATSSEKGVSSPDKFEGSTGKDSWKIP